MKLKFLSEETPKTIDEVRQILLANRGIDDKKSFFELSSMLDISESDVGIDVSQFEIAVNRIKQAIQKMEQIIIYGDYDADGISATAVLWQALHTVGAKVTPFIPRRDTHGYGLSKPGIKEIAEQYHPELIITVDNGIVAAPAIIDAKKRGIEVIITDHHQPEKDAKLRAKIEKNIVAQVHTTQLSGTGVAWFLARAFSKAMAEFGLDLLGLATIADQVPLLSWNRVAAAQGLEALRRTKRVGLQALADQAQVDLNEATSTSVGFTLAPRINAMGRLAHGLDALRLLCTNNTARAYQLAAVLSETNTDRQELTMDQFNIALKLAEPQANWPITIAVHKDFHEGIVGLIAGRLVEKLHKPAIVINLSDALAKGSARSVPNVNVVELLRSVREDLIDVGGHPMAAGFSLEPKKVELFVAHLKKAAEKIIDSDQLEPVVEVECRLSVELISQELLDMVREFAPFGMANREPVFLFEDMQVVKTRIFGRDEQHFSAQCLRSVHAQIEAIFWNQSKVLAEKVTSAVPLSVAGTLSSNTWNGRTKLQIIGQNVD